MTNSFLNFQRPAKDISFRKKQLKKLLLLIVVILFAACSKKNETTAHVQFTNDDPRFTYEAYIDNKPQGIIEAEATQTFSTAVGYHTITVKQTPGYHIIEVDTTIAAGQT